MAQRILSVQDISCVGQCALTVSLPILSAMGYECAILPTALLSSHTAFTHTTFLDLEKELPKILEAWKKESLQFDAICTGYIGSIPSVRLLHTLFSSCALPEAPIIVDPVMGDGGVLYKHFDSSYVHEVRKLIPEADVILPNLTEACLLTETPYEEEPDCDYLLNLHDSLAKMGARAAVITGIPVSPEQIGVSVSSNGQAPVMYTTKRIPRMSHGSGDVFASCFAGHYLAGKDLMSCAESAADFTCLALERTPADHWYGLSFEPLLKELITKN